MIPSDIPKVMEGLDIEVGWVDQSRGEVYAKCPMHRKRTGKDDGHPSWSVNLKTGQHFCFSCEYKGGLIGLVMDLKFPADVFGARRWLRKYMADLDTILEGLPTKEDWSEPFTKKLTVPFGEAWLELFDDPPDHALAERSLTRESVDRFGCRWDTKKDCWILPIYMPDGTFIGWQEKAKGYFRNHPVGMPKKETLFGLGQARRGDSVVLLESPLDCVRFHSLDLGGHWSAVASMGAHVSLEQMRIIIGLTDHLLIALDNPAIDATGKRATDELVRSYRSRLTITVLDYDHVPEVKDLGDMTDDEAVAAVEGAKHALDV